MNRKARYRKTSTKGTVLFTVVTVMFMLIILVLATLMTSTASQSKAYGRFAENQAYFSARSALDATEALAKNSMDFNEDIYDLAVGHSFELEINASAKNIYNEGGPITVRVTKLSETPREFYWGVDPFDRTNTNRKAAHETKQLEIQLTATARYMGVEETVERILLTESGTYLGATFTPPSSGGNNATKAINAFSGGTADHQFFTVGGTAIGTPAGQAYKIKGDTKYVESIFVNSDAEMSLSSGGGIVLYPGNNITVMGNLKHGDGTYEIEVHGKGSYMYVGGELDLTARRNGYNLGGSYGNNKTADANNTYDVITGKAINFGTDTSMGIISVWGKTYVGVDTAAGDAEITQTLQKGRVEFKNDVFVNGTVDILGVRTDKYENFYADLKSMGLVSDSGDARLFAESVTIGGVDINNLIGNTGKFKDNATDVKNALNLGTSKTVNSIGALNTKTLTKTVSLADGTEKNIETKYSANLPYYYKDNEGNVLVSQGGAKFTEGGTDPQVMSAYDLAGVKKSDIDKISNSAKVTVNTGSMATLDPGTTTAVLKPGSSGIPLNSSLYIGPPSDGSNEYTIVLENGTYTGQIYVEEGVTVNFFIRDDANVDLNGCYIVYGKFAESAGYSKEKLGVSNSTGSTVTVDNRTEGRDANAPTPPKINIYSDAKYTGTGSSSGLLAFTNKSYVQGYIYAPFTHVEAKTSGDKRNYKYYGAGNTNIENMDTNVVGSLVCNTIESGNTNGAVFVNPNPAGGGGGGGTGGSTGGWEYDDVETVEIGLIRSSWESTYDK